jgi:hypothetical protein
MKRAISLTLGICLVCANPSMGRTQRSLQTSESGENTLDVSPERLGDVILNRDIELMTRDGTYVKGKVLRTSAEAITLRVKEAEPKDRISGGQATLRLADVSVIHMKKAGSRALAITLGIIGGIALASPLMAGADPDAADAALMDTIIFVTMGLGATGGYLLVRRLTQKTLIINVKPTP